MTAYLLTSAQTTDIYLLALALADGGKPATFDEKIPAHFLPGGPEALEVIPASLANPSA